MTTSVKLSKWLSNSVTESKDKRYRHRILKENFNQRHEIIEDLKLFVQNAHEDARLRLRKITGISLDPLGSPCRNDPARGYPEVLHIQTLKGYFGEIFAGLIATNFSSFEEGNWEVPAFLFRFHIVEFQHLEILRQTNIEAKKRPGRTGDDVLAFQRDENGYIIRSLVCEAKCTHSHDSEMISEAHKKASEANLKPVDIPQLIEILQDYDDLEYEKWIDSLRYLYFQDSNIAYERCDLVSYICGHSPAKNGKKTWIPVDRPHKDYSGGRRLEAVEIHLNGVEELIREVYGKKDNTNGTATS